MKCIRLPALGPQELALQRDPPSVVSTDERWAVLLSEDYTMQELAAMMTGLANRGIRVEALPLGDGVMMLRPQWPHKEPPSAKDLIDCMRDGARAPHALEILP